MKLNSRLVPLLLSIFLVLSVTTQDSSQLAVRKINGLKVDISTEKKAYPAGEDVPVTLTFINTGKDVISVQSELLAIPHLSRSRAPIIVRFKLPDIQVNKKDACETTLQLKPNEQFTKVVILETSQDVLAPGLYDLEVIVTLQYLGELIGKEPASPEKPKRLESNSISFKITKAKSGA